MEALRALFTDTLALSWLIGALIGGYALSVIFASLFASRFYPPNAARLGCWLGAAVWALIVIFWIFGRLLKPVTVPTWLLALLIALVLVFGLALWSTRRRTDE